MCTSHIIVTVDTKQAVGRKNHQEVSEAWMPLQLKEKFDPNPAFSGKEPKHFKQPPVGQMRPQCAFLISSSSKGILTPQKAQ